MGHDGIHPKLLKECHAELAEPITIIIQDSLKGGLVLSLWKLAKTCPIYKKGNKLDPLNYRPVSLTCIICKISETFIRDKIQQNLECNNFISDKQHGFRQKKKKREVGWVK